MQLTLSVSYAVGVLLRAMEAPAGTTVTAAAISKGCKFPPRFLYRVLRRLVDAEIMTGISGPGGGYALARAAPQISLLEIVRAVEGTATPSRLTAVHPRQRPAIEHINKLARESTLQFQRRLAAVSLADLARGQARGRPTRRKPAGTKRGATKRPLPGAKRQGSRPARKRTKPNG